MASARFLLEARILGGEESGLIIELLRPGKEPWRMPLPEDLMRGQAVHLLVDYVTAQFLVDLPKEGIRLGWESIYALVRTTLAEALEQTIRQEDALPPHPPFAA